MNEIKHISIFTSIECDFVEEMEELLKDQSLDLNLITDKDGNSPLHFAVLKQYPRCIKLLLIHSADPNKLHLVSGETPLHYAIGLNLYDIVKMMIEFGGNPNVISTNTGASALHMAARIGSKILVLYFLSISQKVDSRDKYLLTPLMYAASCIGGLTCAQILYNYDETKTVHEDIGGNTALHWAATHGNLKCVEYLISLNFDALKMNYHRQTPLHLAEKNNHYEVADFIKQYISQTGNGKKYNTIIEYILKHPKKSRICSIFVGLIPTFLANTIIFRSLLLNVLAFILVSVLCRGILSFFKPKNDAIVIPFGLAFSCIFLSIGYIIRETYCGMYSYSLLLLLFMLILYSKIFHKMHYSYPGIVSNSNNLKIKTLVEFSQNSDLAGASRSICSTCLVKKPKRSKHCSVCDKCILHFDHHCPWVDCCVGLFNHGIFFLYIFTTFIFSTLSAYICFKRINTSFFKIDISQMSYTRILFEWVTLDLYNTFVGAQAIFYCLFTLGLLSFSLMNKIFYGVTTNEYLHRYKYPYLWSDENMERTNLRKNIYNHGVVKNTLYFVNLLLWPQKEEEE